MADLLTDIESYFVSKGLITAGSMHKDTALDTPDSVVIGYEYAGHTPLPQIESVMRSVQIVARDTSVKNAKAKANDLYKSLKTEDGILDLTASRWCSISLQQPPFKIKVDSNGRSYYGFNTVIITYND